MSEFVAGIPQVPLEFFFDNILLQPAEWHSLAGRFLADEGHIVSGRWIQKSSCSAAADSETDFVSVVNMVIRAGEKFAPHHPTCRLTVVPATTDKPSHLLPPDAQFKLVDSVSPFHVAIPWNIRTTKTPLYSNDDGLILNCQELLSNNSCRRFSYGITVEDDNLRIWLFSRSHELVSSSFNVITEIPNLIRVILSLAFATPEQLGYDTTMSHVADDMGFAQLRLTVGHTVYSTRVWQAYREDDPERIPVAVKDVWVSADAVQEGDQLLELHEKLRTLSHPPLPHPPEHYFLTVIEHGFVPTSDGVDDDTLIMTRSVLPEGGTEKRRKHYRIVFKEVGIPIHDLHSLADVMRALADATRALQLLYELGLVHRDVSAGNILFVNGVGKLANLEFMRFYRGPIPPSPADRYIGTADFMAGEVAINKYRYPSLDFTPADAPVYLDKPAFRYNPFHDLESTSWIGVWVLLYHRQEIPHLKKFFDVHFPRHFTTDTLDNRVLAVSYSLPGFDKSDSFYPVMYPLHKTRVHLYKGYATLESDIHRKYHYLEDEGASSGEGSPFYGIHDKLIHEYEEAARLAEGISLPLFRSDAFKRKATSEPSQVDDVPHVRKAVSPKRPTKKLKSTSPRNPPTTRSSSGAKHRSPNTCPSRRSARLAEKKRSPTRNRAT